MFTGYLLCQAPFYFIKLFKKIFSYSWHLWDQWVASTQQPTETQGPQSYKHKELNHVNNRVSSEHTLPQSGFQMVTEFRGHFSSSHMRLISRSLRLSPRPASPCCTCILIIKSNRTLGSSVKGFCTYNQDLKSVGVKIGRLSWVS